MCVGPCVCVCVTHQEIDFTRPTALVLGNERHGASEEIVAAADHCAIIPMVRVTHTHTHARILLHSTLSSVRGFHPIGTEPSLHNASMPPCVCVCVQTGMVESLNISVAAAICLYEAQQQRARKGLKGDLSSEQRQILKAALSIRSLVG